MQEILSESERCQKSSRSLFRLASVEMWLQGLARDPRDVREAGSATSTSTMKHAAAMSGEGEGVVALCPWVVAHRINGNCVLIYRQTLQGNRI